MKILLISDLHIGKKYNDQEQPLDNYISKVKLFCNFIRCNIMDELIISVLEDIIDSG